MANTTPTPPFAKSAPPPPPLIVLLSHTDLIYEPLPALLSHEDLLLTGKHTHPQSNHVRFHPYKNPKMRTAQARAESSAMAADMDKAAMDRAAMDRALSAMDRWSPLTPVTPSPRSTPTPEIPQTNVSSSSSSASSTPRATPLTESSKTTVIVSKIRKPRPKGAGRYNLTDIITMENRLLESIKDDVRKLMYKHLDTSLCLSSQDKDKLNMIRKQIISKYPIIDDYSHAWPVDHILMTLLKYTSSHNKSRALKEAATMIKQVT